MTIKARKNVIISGLTVSIFLFLVSIFALTRIYLIKSDIFDVKLLNITKELTNIFPLLNMSNSKDAILIALSLLQLILLFQLIISFYLNRLYKKTESSEIFFLIFFIVSFAFESLRATNTLIALSDTPYYMSIISTRTLYFGRILSLISILFASLYMIGFNYKHISTLLLIAIFTSFSLAIIIPVDTTAFNTSLAYSVGIKNTRLFFSISLYILSLTNFTIAYLKNKNKRHLYTLIYYILIMIASFSYQYMENILFINTSIVIEMIAALLMAKAIEKIYLPI